MPFMKVIDGKLKGKIAMFDVITDEAVIQDIDGNNYFREQVEELTEQEVEKYLKVEEIDLGI